MREVDTCSDELQDFFYFDFGEQQEKLEKCRDN